MGRRSPAEIAAEQEAKAERARQQAQKKAARIAADSEKAWSRYQIELGGVAEREAQRQFQQDGLDYIDGRDTEGARRFAAEVARRLNAVSEANKRVEREGNPLRINGPVPELPDAVKRKQERKRMEAAGFKRDTVTVFNEEKGETERAEPWHGASSIRRMEIHEGCAGALDWLSRQWFTAHRGLKGQSWELPVDGQSGAHNIHLARKEALDAIAQCQREIGQRDFAICVAVMHGATARQIKAMGGGHWNIVKSDITAALNALEGFRTGTRRKDRTWEAFEKFNAERAAMIEKAEREVG